MTSQEMMQLDSENVLGTYARFPVCLQSGKGCRAQSPEGKEYLDFTSGIGVNSLGWCDAEWVAAVAGQAATLQHTSNPYYTAPAPRLAQALCSLTGMSKVFFGNSGAEANEGAIKAARKYSLQKYGEGRATILTLHDSFHGRTMATLTATGQEHFHQYFHPFLPGFRHVSPGDIPALEAALTEDVCAVLFEPIQGEGGVLPLDADYLKTMQALCKQKDILLIADEVQCGVGRTGHFLACQGLGIQPDIVTLAKGLGGGLPIGAVLLAESCADALGKGDHGSTFGGNPVCCAGAGVVMARLDDAFLAEVARKGEKMKQGLLALPHVESVSGAGLMLGVAFAPPVKAGDVVAAALKAGLLCLTAKDKMRLLPPLVITDAEIEEGLATLRDILQAI